MWRRLKKIHEMKFPIEFSFLNDHIHKEIFIWNFFTNPTQILFNVKLLWCFTIELAFKPIMNMKTESGNIKRLHLGIRISRSDFLNELENYYMVFFVEPKYSNYLYSITFQIGTWILKKKLKKINFWVEHYKVALKCEIRIYIIIISIINYKSHQVSIGEDRIYSMYECLLVWEMNFWIHRKRFCRIKNFTFFCFYFLRSTKNTFK